MVIGVNTRLVIKLTEAEMERLYDVAELLRKIEYTAQDENVDSIMLIEEPTGQTLSTIPHRDLDEFYCLVNDFHDYFDF